MDFHAAPSHGRWVGLGLVVLGAAMVAALLVGVRVQGPGPVAAGLLVAAGLVTALTLTVAYWVWGLWHLRYRLSRDGLIIAAPGASQIVPMGEITGLVKGRPYEAPLAGLRWPGFWHGRSTLRDDDGALCSVLVYATRPPAEQLVVVTPGLAYAISPANGAEFAEDFAMRRRLGPAQVLRQQTTGPAWLAGSLAGDGVAKRLFVASLLLNLAAFLVAVYRFPALPDQVPLRFEYDSVRRAAVAVDLVPRANLWSLPLIGLAVAVLNGTLAWLAFPRARLAAQMLLAGVLLVQLSLLLTLGRVLF